MYSKRPQLSLHDKVGRSPLTKEEIQSLRADLRLRFILFMALSVVFALISIYDHIMVKILMMFLLIILFALFLKYHLRLKHDINEGDKCMEIIEVPTTPQVGSGIQGNFLLIGGAYGHLKLRVTKGEPLPASGEHLRVNYLPLSNKVISWTRSANE